MSSGNYYREFGKFMFMSQVEKAFHTLEGLLKGIAIDEAVSPQEVDELSNWLDLYRDMLAFHSFSPLLELLSTALSDRYLDDEERNDILWLCGKYTSGDNPYYDLVASDIQRLQGMLHGIMADNKIETAEIEQLKAWLEQNRHLTGVYPYDELGSIIGHFLQDGVLAPEEIKFLKGFFAEFIDLKTSINLNPSELSELKQNLNISGVCAADPKISFPGRTFSLTGRPSKASRFEIKNRIESLGGRYERVIAGDTDYLVVADQGLSCWAFSCCGRKVEQAMKMRKAGHPIVIVREGDFWEAATGKCRENSPLDAALNPKILVVDDEREIADLVEVYLQNENYTVFKFYNAADALACVEREPLSLAVLDVMLPDMSGFALCQKIREDHLFPIIMLTAKVEDLDKITGLTLGADDYITKPFNPLELVARVKTQLRRYTRYNAANAGPPPGRAYDFAGLYVCQDRHKCTLYGKELALTPIEFNILWYLCEHRGRVVSSEELFEAVWGERYLENNNTVMAHIARLREKMHEPSRKPKFVKTVWGVGYTIE